MLSKAKLFMDGLSQAVRLPNEFRFEGSEVFIRRDPVSGDVVLSNRPDTWDGLFLLDTKNAVLVDFMTEADRNQGQQEREPFSR